MSTLVRADGGEVRVAGHHPSRRSGPRLDRARDPCGRPGDRHR
jgi:hypothetical protein